MNYQELHQNSLANRRAKVAPQVSHNRLGLKDLGKVAPDSVRASAFKHFSNLLQSFRQRHIENLNEGQVRRARKEIANIAEKWNFELPEWF